MFPDRRNGERSIGWLGRYAWRPHQASYVKDALEEPVLAKFVIRYQVNLANQLLYELEGSLVPLPLERIMVLASLKFMQDLSVISRKTMFGYEMRMRNCESMIQVVFGLMGEIESITRHVGTNTLQNHIDVLPVYAAGGGLYFDCIPDHEVIPASLIVFPQRSLGDYPGTRADSHQHAGYPVGAVVTYVDAQFKKT